MGDDDADDDDDHNDNDDEGWFNLSFHKTRHGTCWAILKTEEMYEIWNESEILRIAIKCCLKFFNKIGVLHGMLKSNSKN